ncbi:MAG: helix-turn-helix domain-containing protein [Prolixibacteraceae bacterium]|jgi:predicted DNA-binding transcriptional regulator YafY|nr:helix-turn-helix domain-containing protein [Prolixibacteraceae bacterium]
MKYLKRIENLSTVHCAILHNQKGSAEEIAQQLEMTRSSLYKYIDELKSFGAHIQYSRKRNCFEYTIPFEFYLSIKTPEVELYYGA